MMTAPATSFLFRHSLVPATVTKSYHKLGRVKVRFPWMTDKQESDWVRVAAPAAGDKCGVFFMPEEHDQVLVAFSHSHIERSYVLGVLWSNASKPPDEDRAKRQLKSRSGHVITLDDTKDAEQITIVDKSTKNKIVLDAKNNTITIECGGDLTIEAEGKLALKSKSKDVSIDGQNITLTAGTKLAAEGKQMELKGPSGVKINDGALEVT
jgi:phage baseplate assembly protein V